jgi:hypothetical protein
VGARPASARAAGHAAAGVSRRIPARLVKAERVSSDQPVELLRGADRFTGERFDYDNQSGVANLVGQVRGVIQPARR